MLILLDDCYIYNNIVRSKLKFLLSTYIETRDFYARDKDLFTKN